MLIPHDAQELIRWLSPAWGASLRDLKCRRAEELFADPRGHSKTMSLFRHTLRSDGLASALRAVWQYKRDRRRKRAAKDVALTVEQRAALQARLGQIASNRDGKLYACVRVTGGIGDLVCIGRWLREFHRRFRSVLEIDIFYGKGAPALSFIVNSTGASNLFPDAGWRACKRQYQLALMVDQFIRLDNDPAFGQRAANLPPALSGLLSRIETWNEEFGFFLKKHPAADGLFADVAQHLEMTRHAAMFSLCGWRPGSLAYLKVSPDEELLHAHGLRAGRYITVHDGWDANFKIADGRPTKSYPLEKWQVLVARLRRDLPDYPIVQLGGKDTGSDIAGVDVNLKGKLPLDKSAALIAGAALHVDAESGLVHLAAAVGTRCVVLFGPTSWHYYGYEQNLNVSPKHCGNCMWTTDQWMEKCPRGMVVPECMDSHDPEFVCRRIVAFMEREQIVELEKREMIE